jgi:hypothetical protein
MRGQELLERRNGSYPSTHATGCCPRPCGTNEQVPEAFLDREEPTAEEKKEEKVQREEAKDPEAEDVVDDRGELVAGKGKKKRLGEEGPPPANSLEPSLLSLSLSLLYLRDSKPSVSPHLDGQ